MKVLVKQSRTDGQTGPNLESIESNRIESCVKQGRNMGQTEFNMGKLSLVKIIPKFFETCYVPILTLLDAQFIFLHFVLPVGE